MARPKINPKLGHGGHREGSGRKPDWLKETCRKLIDRNKLLDFLARVAAGEETEQRLGKEGVETVEVSVHDRLHALEMLLDRGFGKPAQAVDVTSGNEPIRVLFEDAASPKN